MPMPKFTPTPEQREVVAALIAAKKPMELICAAIVNPRTQRPVSEKVLRKLFKPQLTAEVDVIVEAYRGLREALRKMEAWAIKYVFDHHAEFKAKEKDPATPAAVKKEISAINQGIVVQFVDRAGRIVSELSESNGPTTIDHQQTPPNLVRVEDLSKPETPRTPRPEHAIPPHDGPVIDSTDENAVKPLYTRQQEQPVPAETPRTYRERREALKERAEMEGWPAENPRVPGNPNRLWRNGRYV